MIIVKKGKFSKGVLYVLSAFTNGMRVHGVIALSVNEIFWNRPDWKSGASVRMIPVLIF